MKGRYNTMNKINVKKFVKEHKTELFVGGTIIAGAVLATLGAKKLSDAIKSVGPDATTRVWNGFDLKDLIGDMKDEFLSMPEDYVLIGTDKGTYLTSRETSQDLMENLLKVDAKN